MTFRSVQVILQWVVLGIKESSVYYVVKILNFKTTVNFQNNAQVQINAWFKLTPGTKHTVYNL